MLMFKDSQIHSKIQTYIYIYNLHAHTYSHIFIYIRTCEYILYTFPPNFSKSIWQENLASLWWIPKGRNFHRVKNKKTPSQEPSHTIGTNGVALYRIHTLWLHPVVVDPMGKVGETDPADVFFWNVHLPPPPILRGLFLIQFHLRICFCLNGLVKNHRQG